MRVRGRALFQERLAAGVQHGGTERAGGLGKRAPARRLARRLQKRLQHEEAAPEQASGRGAIRGQYYCGSGRAGALKKPQEVVLCSIGNLRVDAGQWFTAESVGGPPPFGFLPAL